MNYRALWPIAQGRQAVCASAEIDFRSAMEWYTSNQIPNQIGSRLTVVYCRVNAKCDSMGFTILLNVLQNETSLKFLQCVRIRKDQLIEPMQLADELCLYLRERDNKSGLLVLAIDRINKLSGKKRLILAEIFTNLDMPSFATIFILPRSEWDFLIDREHHEFESFLKKMDAIIKNKDDLRHYLSEYGNGFIFDENDNFLDYQH